MSNVNLPGAGAASGLSNSWPGPNNTGQAEGRQAVNIRHQRLQDSRFNPVLARTPVNPAIFHRPHFAVSNPAAVDPHIELGILPKTLKHFGLAIRQVSNLKRVSEKIGGSPDTSAMGGVYVNEDGKKMLIKKSAQPAHTFAEFLNSTLHRSFVPDGVQVIPLRMNNEIYLASIYKENATALYVIGLQSAGLPVPGKRPVVHVPGSGKTTHAIDQVLLECTPFVTPSLACSQLIGNNDVHTENILGEVYQDGIRKGHLCGAHVIDMGWGSRETLVAGRPVGDHFGPELHPNSMRRRLPVIGPTNHHKDLPEKMRSGPAYIDQLIKCSAHDFNAATDIAFEQGVNIFEPEVMADFAKNAGFRLTPAEASDPETVKQTYLQRIHERQASMKRYAADLALGLFTLDPDPATGELYLHPDTDDHGRPLINDYLTNPNLRAYIERYVRGEPNAAKLRNHALDKYQGTLRHAMADLLSETAPSSATGQLRRPLRKT